MKKVRIMDQPADFERLGMNPDKVELWEDGRRDNNRAGAFEWWYFDAILDDGSKLVIDFGAKLQTRTHEEGGSPFALIRINRPDGTSYEKFYCSSEEDSSFAKDTCDVHVGENYFVGDFKEYKIKVVPAEGVGADITLTSQASPWRAGTGYFTFGEDEQSYFTWLCAVPRGRVEGTITIDGETIPVTGAGYHDHQWGNIHHMFIWNHWLWGRQSTDDYTILIFDFMTRKEYGHKRFPLCFVQDRSGKLLFSNFEGAKVEVPEEYTDEVSGKDYPVTSIYTMENNGSEMIYTITEKETLEARFEYAAAPEPARKQMDAMGVRTSYARYLADGEFNLNTKDGTYHDKGDLIYEFAYLGTTYKVGDQAQ